MPGGAATSQEVSDPTPSSVAGKCACGFSQRLPPGHYRKYEHGEEYKRHNRGQHEIVVAPRSHEERRHHGCACGDGQGE